MPDKNNNNHLPAQGSLPPLRRASAWAGLARTVLAAGLLAAGMAGARSAEPPAVVDVQPGDTFSAIAARYTGSVRTWSKLYDARASGLADPNRITPGMRFELVADASGRRYLHLIGAGEHAAAAAAPAKPAAAAAPPAVPPVPVPASDTLVIGVLPNISPGLLMGQYDNLKSYLERLNPQKVRIVLPANFKAFFDSTMRGEFDLAISAPHFARVAQLDGRMTPLALYEPRINAQFIGPADGTLAGPTDVRGKSLAFANPQSLVAMYGQQWLHTQNLDPGKDYEIKAARTDMGVGRMLLTGEVAAAIMSNGEFRGLPPEESSRLKIVEIFARIPNFVVLGNPRLGPEQLARLKAQMLGFIADPQDGAAFSKATGITGMVDADEAQLRELDAFVAPTRRAMGIGN